MWISVNLLKEARNRSRSRASSSVIPAKTGIYLNPGFPISAQRAGGMTKQTGFPIRACPQLDWGSGMTERSVLHIPISYNVSAYLMFAVAIAKENVVKPKPHIRCYMTRTE